MARKRNLALEMLKVGTNKTWTSDGNNWHSSKITHICPQCGAGAVHKLPEPLLSEQPDATTHVCNPAFGGCNQGYAFDEQLGQDNHG